MTNTQNPAKMGAKISDQLVPQRGCKYKVRWDLKKGGGGIFTRIGGESTPLVAKLE